MNGLGSYRKQEIMHHIWKASVENQTAQILQQILTTQEILDWTQKCIQWRASALTVSQLQVLVPETQYQDSAVSNTVRNEF